MRYVFWHNRKFILTLMVFIYQGWGEIPKLMAQDSIPSTISLNGYISNMQSVLFERFQGDWISDNLIHNRLNLKWHTADNRWNAVVELRNRFISGESVKYIPGYADMIENDEGLFNLSRNLASGRSYLLNSRIDRAYVDFTYDKFALRIGRQRINWGQCMAWNPNDLFNTYSFFDFDYIEKPGSDAVRLQYYTSGTSSLEFAVKANVDKQLTTMAMYRFNRWGYDIQLLGGVLNDQDWVVGGGWSGSIEGASFYGELSYFHPQRSFADTTGVCMLSIGGAYVFKNSLSLGCEVLYNPGKGSSKASFNEFYLSNLSPKTLSFTTWNLLLQGSYPVTPLFNVSLSGIWFPGIKGYYIGPSLSYSLAENLDISLIAQSFGGKLATDQVEYHHLGFIRLKWNW